MNEQRAKRAFYIIGSMILACAIAAGIAPLFLSTAEVHLILVGMGLGALASCLSVALPD